MINTKNEGLGKDISVIPVGLFYGWGVLAHEIALVFTPEDPYSFANQHGIFVGAFVLFISSAPLFALQILIVDKAVVSEQFIHALGLILIVLGLILGFFSLQYKLLPLFYTGCLIFCGLGELCIFRRVLFHHQLYFKRIGLEKLGGGIFGFLIGVWTIIYFLIAEPLLKRMSVGFVLLVYALLMTISVSYPLMVINDNIANNEQVCVNNDDVEMVEIKSVENVENYEYVTLTLLEIIKIPQTWELILFFAIVLTPGWGIKLGSIFILKQLFDVSTYYAECVSMIYLTSYAFGRLSALLAECFGVKRTYISFIILMIVLLFLLPNVGSFGKEVFVIILCIIGFLYGGCKALFYSVVFDVFGAKNYRLAFSVSNIGFGIAVIIGVLTSAYSFSKNASIDVGYIWFYSMGCSSSVALIIVLFFLKPYNYSSHIKSDKK